MKIIFMNDQNSVWDEKYEKILKDQFKEIEEIKPIDPHEIPKYMNDNDPDDKEYKGIAFINDDKLFYRNAGEKIFYVYDPEDAKKIVPKDSEEESELNRGWERVDLSDNEEKEEKKEPEWKYVRSFILKKNHSYGGGLGFFPTIMEQYFYLDGKNKEKTNKRMMVFERISAGGQIQKAFIGFMNEKKETIYNEIDASFYYKIMNEENFSDAYMVQYKKSEEKKTDKERWELYKYVDSAVPDIMKVFFTTEEDRDNFEMPEEFNNEITKDDRFHNLNLALDPFNEKDGWGAEYLKENPIAELEKKEENQNNPFAMLGGLFGGGLSIGEDGQIKAIDPNTKEPINVPVELPEGEPTDMKGIISHLMTNPPAVQMKEDPNTGLSIPVNRKLLLGADGKPLTLNTDISDPKVQKKYDYTPFLPYDKNDNTKD